MNPVERALDALLRTPLLSTRTIGAVWLFGSHVRGEADVGSDVDLAILCAPSLANDRFALMERVARAAGVEVDVIDLETANPILAREIVTSGRILVERNEEHVERTPSRAMLAALRRLRAMPKHQREADALHLLAAKGLLLAAERALHVAAEAIFDIGHHVLAGRGLPIPATYRVMKRS